MLHLCFWLVLLQKYITMHGPMNVKFYVTVLRKSEFETRDCYCGMGGRNTCRGEPQACHITAVGMRYTGTSPSQPTACSRYNKHRWRVQLLHLYTT